MATKEEIKDVIKNIFIGWHFYRIKTIDLAIEEIIKIMNKEFVKGLALGFFLSGIFFIIYFICVST